VPEVARAARTLLLTMGLSISALAAVGCGGGPGAGSTQDGVSNGRFTPASSWAAGANVPDDSCASPSTGCPCAQEGAIVDCQGPHIRTGNYTSCAPGERMCSNGTWGACVGKSVVQDANEVTQDYPAGCASGKTVRWGALSLEGLTPGDSQIAVVVQAAGSQEDLDEAQAIPLGSFGGATDTSWTSVAVQPLLDSAGVSDEGWLRVTLTLVQASHGGALPTLAGWQEASVCASGS
jgi:hypothetical protein